MDFLDEIVFPSPRFWWLMCCVVATGPEVLLNIACWPEKRKVQINATLLGDDNSDWRLRCLKLKEQDSEHAHKPRDPNYECKDEFLQLVTWQIFFMRLLRQLTRTSESIRTATHRANFTRHEHLLMLAPGAIFCARIHLRGVACGC